MIPDISPVSTGLLADPLFVEKGISVSVLRTDRIHPIVSGNKLYKLHYFLEQVLQSNHKTLLTFGGAFSNHLVATAYAGSVAGIKTIAVVRGEAASELSGSLQECQRYGMQLHFISRDDYAKKETAALQASLHERFGEFILVPEGGYHPLGAMGAAGILQGADHSDYTHICTAAGTATTAAGLLLSARAGQTIVTIPVLKGMTDMEERIRFLTKNKSAAQIQFFHDYHFGGYAKKDDHLIAFMNQCWELYQLPLDFVYTAKMFYAVKDLVKKDWFPPGSNILCIHTGGLQGNRSLTPGALLY